MPTYASQRLSASHAVRAYANIGLETEVLAASPERLTSLLFSGARAAIAKARLYMEGGQIAERGKAISHATRIVDEGLKQSLNQASGGEIAANLASLYDYIIRCLLTANLKSDPKQLDVADRLLADLQEAWQQAVDPKPGDAGTT
jgi:flagellar protein FliS